MSQQELEYRLNLVNMRIETIHSVLRQTLKELDEARIGLAFFNTGLHPNGNGNGNH